MNELDFANLRVSKEEYKALKKAARRKDGVIQSHPDSLSTSSGLCHWTNLVPDGMGGLKRTQKSQFVISNDGLLYVKWSKTQSLIESWAKIKKFFIFWIPTGISIIALIISIIALVKQ